MNKTQKDDKILQPYCDKDVTRFYFALTNFCNRACELCSCHSDPGKNTFLTFEAYLKIIDDGMAQAIQEGKSGRYETQLEGGEPTIHPDFYKILDYSMKHKQCSRVIVCTNAVKIPFDHDKDTAIKKIKDWIRLFKEKPFILKPSINSHLITHSSIHMEKMVLIMIAWQEMMEDNELLDGSHLYFNVRRIPAPMKENSERWITEMTKELGLFKYCNDFEYQKYGKAKNEEFLKEPYIVANPVKFHLIAPDGKNFGSDLISRADHMENMK